jgi:hypothetical protein
MRLAFRHGNFDEIGGSQAVRQGQNRRGDRYFIVARKGVHDVDGSIVDRRKTLAELNEGL